MTTSVVSSISPACPLARFGAHVSGVLYDPVYMQGDTPVIMWTGLS